MSVLARDRQSPIFSGHCCYKQRFIWFPYMATWFVLATLGVSQHCVYVLPIHAMYIVFIHIQLQESDLEGVAASVLGVRITPMHAASSTAEWSSWPLSSSHSTCTMQTAWLQAHILDRLGSRVAWDLTALHACAVVPQRMRVASSGEGSGSFHSNQRVSGINAGPAAVPVMHDKGRASGGSSVGGLGGLGPLVAGAVHLSPAGAHLSPHISPSGKADASPHVAEGSSAPHVATMSIAAATGNTP